MAGRRGRLVGRSDGMLLVAYALARLGEMREGRSDAPPAWLGADTWNAAYDCFYEQLGDGRTKEAFRFSLKNARDKLDPYLPSRRRGWLTPEGQTPAPVGWVRRLLDEWTVRSDADLRSAVQNILEGPGREFRPSQEVRWPEVRRRIERTTRHTVDQSGKVQRRMLKNKELRCADLEATLDELVRRQGYRCAQTGISFVESDPDLRASLDRIDSDGHYEDGTIGDGPHNLQLVTHWYNMAKGKRRDLEMHRLLRLHATRRRSVEEGSGEEP